jgi:hypothetical protein
MNKSSASKAIFWGGLIAGALDLAGACVVSWVRAGLGPVRVMQSISSGLIGSAAYSGGAKTAALGVVLHFLLATAWTAVFYAASRKLRFLLEQPVLWGLVYGVFVYAFMNFVVLPLSAFPPSRFAPTLTGRLIQLLLIMFCIGLPIAIIVRRFSKQP